MAEFLRLTYRGSYLLTPWILTPKINNTMPMAIHILPVFCGLNCGFSNSISIFLSSFSYSVTVLTG